MTSSAVIPLENLEKVAGQVDETDLDLLPFFEEEAKVELSKIETILHSWHAKSQDCPLEPLRLRFHTLKGAANSIGQLRLGSLAGGLKDVLDLFTSAQALSLRLEVTKVCVMVVEAAKVLIKEARAPQHNRVKREFVANVAQGILNLKKKADELKTL
jgi:chemotaxis protein histidine kinase CheA